MSFKYYIKLTIAFLIRFKIIISLGILIGIIIFTTTNTFLNSLSTGKKETIGITGRFRPDDLPQEILLLISQGLTHLDEGNLEPGLASSWESPDKGKTWIFKLNENIYWQDGTKLKSSDINYEFSDVSVERPDDSTIIFILHEGPYSPFPTVLTKPLFKKGLLGTGEWTVKKISIVNTFVQELILKKEKDTQIYKYFPTTDRTKLAYKLGQVDRIDNILDPSPFEKWNNSLIFSSIDVSQVITLFFNTSDEILSDKSIRQALIYAINKNSLGTRAETPINPYSWAYNPQVKAYDFDQERSKTIINQLPDEIKNKLEIKLVSTPSLLSTAEKISRDWEDVGIKNQIQVSSIIPSEFQVFLTIFDIPEDPDQYPIWHSTRIETNLSKLTNPRIDKLLEDGRIELEIEERRKIYLDFQRYLLEEAPAAFLYHPTYYSVERK